MGKLSDRPSRRVLVTRSEPGASETTGRLEAMDVTAVVEPAFGIEAMPGLSGAALPGFDILAFTSVNGVRAFAALRPEREVPVYCVGARTAEAAREAGFADVRSADGDVTALAELIVRNVGPGARVLHTGNADSRGDLAGQLTAAGRAAAFVATYHAAMREPGPQLSRHLSGEAAFEAILVHSPKAARHVAGLLEAHGSHAPVRVAAISEAAAAPLRPHAEALAIAASPDEAALLAALETILRASLRQG
ncbi:MAG: uroporphyrinogen-III synthase [Hyphomonadaceae bacterium]